MAKKKRVYEDDDGRTIASMANVESPYARMLFPPLKKKGGAEPQKPKKPDLTEGEARQVIRAARLSALLVALGITAVFALVLLFLVFVWFK